MFCYRPKRSFGQGNIFTPVCHSFCSRGGVPDQAPPNQVGTPSDQAGTPQDQTPPWTRQVHPPDQAGTPPRDQTPPGTRHPPGPGRYSPPGTRHPPGTADSGIRSTFGRYASYWNAFLFHTFLAENMVSLLLRSI